LFAAVQRLGYTFTALLFARNEPGSVSARCASMSWEARMHGHRSWAEWWARGSVLLDPNRGNGYVQLGQAIEMGGRMNEAEAIYEEGLRHDPRYHWLHWALGYRILHADRLDDAARHFEPALAARPDEPNFLTSLGGARLEQGRTEEAVRLLERSLELDPTNHATLAELGTARWYQDRFEEAAALLRDSIAHGQRSARVHYLLSSVLGEMSEWLEAQAEINVAVDMDPGNVTYRRWSEEVFSQLSADGQSVR
jgi:tetratricopeptide (TPR) repeat protein